MTKLSSFLLSLTMVFSVAAPALAQTENPDSNTNNGKEKSTEVHERNAERKANRVPGEKGSLKGKKYGFHLFGSKEARANWKEYKDNFKDLSDEEKEEFKETAKELKEDFRADFKSTREDRKAEIMEAKETYQAAKEAADTDEEKKAAREEYKETRKDLRMGFMESVRAARTSFVEALFNALSALTGGEE